MIFGKNISLKLAARAVIVANEFRFYDQNQPKYPTERHNTTKHCAIGTITVSARLYFARNNIAQCTDYNAPAVKHSYSR